MTVVDSRYARAFAAVALEQKLEPAAAQAQLNDFAGTLDESTELREVLENPSIDEQQKLDVLDALGAKLGLDRTVRNFIAVITHHQRLHELRDIIAAYATLADEETGIAEADVTTARPMDDRTKELVEAQVAKLAGGQKIRATYHEDPALLGGAVVKLGSTVYDGSVRSQLQQLKQRLVAAQS